jgi:hypothetical protein
MVLESWGPTGLGLREYFRLVAEACGCSGEVFSVQHEPPFSGYLPLETRVPAFPEVDVALLWDERTGWSTALETRTNELVVLSYLDTGLVPSPEAVAEFASNPGSGSASPTAEPAGEDVHALLAEYAVAGLRPLAG